MEKQEKVTRNIKIEDTRFPYWQLNKQTTELMQLLKMIRKHSTLFEKEVK